MYTALRSLARSPGFSAVAIITLALGIGMNTAMFSILNGFLLRPLNYPRSERLVRIDRNTPRLPHDNPPARDVDVVAGAAGDLADFATYRYWAFTVVDGEHAPDVPIAASVSANFFDVLGVKAVAGRTFFPDEDQAGKNDVAVISHRYWRSYFDGAPDIVGRVVKLDGVPVRIVGVLAPDNDLVRIAAPIALFRPLTLTPELHARRDTTLGTIGRLRDDASIEQLAARLDAISKRLVAENPTENAAMTLGVRTLQSTTLTGTGLNMTFVLVALSGFVLLIACANLAGLLLARAVNRVREYSVRAALGATRIQLVKPLALECLLLAIGGGAAAMLVSAWTTDWLSGQFGSPDSPVDFSTDGRVLIFTVAATLATAVLFGIGPAWWASRVQVSDSLKTGGRGSSGTRGQTRYRQVLIVTQFALALVLLAGAGLFLRGLHKLVTASMGWEPDHVVSGIVNLASPARYGTAEPIIAFHTQLHDRLVAIPGVTHASVSFEVPLFNPPARRNYLVQGRPAPAPGEEIAAFTNGVSAGFLDTMGLRLLRGRFFDASDHLTSRPVVVINRTMAQSLFPGQDAVGQFIAQAGTETPQWAEVVGVVEDVRALNMRPSPVRFQVYKPYAQEAWQFVSIAVRVADPAKAASVLEPIRRAVASLDAEMPVMRLMAVPVRIKENFGVWNTINLVLVMFAALGLFLSALGIYGVVSRLVAQRTSEIGVRVALGAQMRDIMVLVLRSGMRMTLAGGVIGAVAAFFLSRLVANALPAFRSDDPLPIVLAGVLLVFVALLACWLPARRAARINPVEALRTE